jgi:hypothetical protein
MKLCICQENSVFLSRQVTKYANMKMSPGIRDNQGHEKRAQWTRRRCEWDGRNASGWWWWDDRSGMVLWNWTWPPKGWGWVSVKQCYARYGSAGLAHRGEWRWTSLFYERRKKRSQAVWSKGKAHIKVFASVFPEMDSLESIGMVTMFP